MDDSNETSNLNNSLDLDSSVVVISEDDVANATPSTTPTKVTPASKRKHDVLVEIERLERAEIGGGVDNSSEFLNMERGSPELRRKSRGTTPVSPIDTVEKKPNVPDVISEIDFDSNLPETVTLLQTPNGVKVYIVGTAHFSEESQNDVTAVMRAVRPQCLVVELCSSRIDILVNDEQAVLAAAGDITFDKILKIMRRDGAVQGLLYVTLLTMSAHVTRELGMAPGGEFRRAFQEAAIIGNCKLLLGDRPINATIARALAALTWWQCVKIFWNLVVKKDPIKKEDVEKCKQKDFLEAMMLELAGEFPSLTETLVNERDKYLCYSLQNAANAVSIADNRQPIKVVGVVGMGHVPGIKKYFGNVSDAEVKRLMTIPPPSLNSRIIKYTIKGCVLGGMLYGMYKVVPYDRILQFARR